MKPIGSAKNLKESTESMSYLAFFQLEYATLKNFLKTINKKHYFDLFSSLLIITNLIILAIDSVSLSKGDAEILAIFDFVCIQLFFCEVLMLIIISPKQFFNSFFNVTDFFLLIINFFAIFYLFFGKHGSLSELHDRSLYSFIRSLQVLRMNRLVFSTKIFPGISSLMLEMLEVVAALKHFLILILIFFLWITLMGRDLFSMQIINKNFLSDLSVEIERMNFKSFFKSLIANIMIFFNEDWNITTSTHMKLYHPVNCLFLIFCIMTLAMFLNKFFLALLINGLIQTKKMKNFLKQHSLFQKIFLKLQLFILLKIEKLPEIPRLKWSLFKKNSILKQKISGFLENNLIFEKAMLCCCCFSLLLVGLHNNFENDQSTYNSILKYLDLPILIIFIFELIILCIDEKNRFFSQKIIIRFVICLSYLLYFITDLSGLKILVVFRFLLIINQYKDLKRAVQALLVSFWEIIYLFAFYFLFILLFAIIGVKLFKGVMWSCQNIELKFVSLIITKDDCYDYGGDWINSDFNFDNIFSGMNLLFAIANSSGWLPLMY